MWREYSSGYIKNNRSSGITVIAAAFLSALLLSLLCGVFYNLWKYDVERIEREEGSWQSRITGEFDPEEIRAVQSFAGVTKVEVREEESGETVLDLYFQNMSQVLEDTPKAARLAGASKEDVTYHHALLSMYLVRDPEDPAPRLVFPFFILVTLLASVSLIVIIHNAFAVSMNDRVYQLGILSSVGAAPGQIRACLMQEAAVLCTLPVLAGNLLGIAGSAGVMEITNVIARDIPAGNLWLSSAGLCSDSPGIRSHNLDFGMDSCQKIKQDDADGSIEAHRGSSAKTQEKFPYPCRCFWDGGRAGRQCLKGTAKVLKDGFFISDTVASGFYADAVLLYTFSYQYEGNLF